MAAAAADSSAPNGLYSVLGLERTATQSEIKRAYHKLALRLHPDKNPAEEREAANEKFRSLQRVYSILGDEEKRKVYDDTGDEDALTGEQFDSLYRYYRNVYAKVTVSDIEQVERSYRGSADEERELKELYTRFGGDMDSVFCWLCCSRVELDSHRFMETIQKALEAGELKRSAKFEKWAKAVARRPVPQDVLGAPGGAADDAGLALVAAIRGRAQQSSSKFLEELERKYAGGSEDKGKKEKKQRR